MACKTPIVASSKYEAQKLKALFSHVWSLGYEDRAKLALYCLIKTTPSELVEKIDTAHSWVDYITYTNPNTQSKFICKVNYLNGSFQVLEDLISNDKGNVDVFISVRIVTIQYEQRSTLIMCNDKIGIALVLINPEQFKAEGLKCYTLDGKEIVS